MKVWSVECLKFKVPKVKERALSAGNLKKEEAARLGLII